MHFHCMKAVTQGKAENTRVTALPSMERGRVEKDAVLLL